jgi:hypothetical protein
MRRSRHGIEVRRTSTALPHKFRLALPALVTVQAAGMVQVLVDRSRGQGTAAVNADNIEPVA